MALVSRRSGSQLAGGHGGGAFPSGFGPVLGRVSRSAVPFTALAVIAVPAKSGGLLAVIDHSIVNALRDRRHPAAVAAARAVSSLAEPGFAAGVLAVSAVMTARQAGWRAACAPGLAVASGAMVRRRLSHVIARPRPPAAGWLTEPEGFSLPSKHTTLAALTAGALAASTYRGPFGRAAPLLTAAGVGASRVYLGVHWPSDVLAGWLFAEGWLRLVVPAVSTPASGQPGVSGKSVTQERALNHGHA